MRLRQRQGGYTLIEMLMVIAIFSLASALVFGVVVFLYRVYGNVTEQAYALQNARVGIEQLSRHLRAADQGVEGTYALVTIDPYTVTFFADIDGTGAKRLRYYLDNSTLMRGTITATGSPLSYPPSDEVLSVVAEHVRNAVLETPLFTYFNSAGVEITNFTDVTAVQFVRIDLVANINPARAPEDFLLRSSASLRNVKDNL